MRVAIIIILILILFGYFAVNREFTIGKTIAVESYVDGVKYRVHLNHDNPQLAADTMANLNAKMIKLLRHLRYKYLRSPGQNLDRRIAVKNLLNRYNPDNLIENSPRDPDSDTSYIINKGDVLALCLRERDPTQSGKDTVYDFHDLNILTFVTLHEITHISIDAIDHPPKFWSAFKFMLNEAEEANIIYNIDYRYDPINYCGLQIDYNPVFDNKTQSI